MVPNRAHRVVQPIVIPEISGTNRAIIKGRCYRHPEHAECNEVLAGRLVIHATVILLGGQVSGVRGLGKHNVRRTIQTAAYTWIKRTDVRRIRVTHSIAQRRTDIETERLSILHDGSTTACRKSGLSARLRQNLIE